MDLPLRFGAPTGIEELSALDAILADRPTDYVAATMQGSQ
jgi:hypothetical protein